MMRVVIRVLAFALAFFFALPMIEGIEFHGNFAHAVAMGGFFALMSWAVGYVALSLTRILGIATLGLAYLVLIPMWLLGWWLLPALSLKLLAGMLPAYLTVSGWGAAIFGGLVMLVIGILTGTRVKVKKPDQSGDEK